MTFFSDIGNYNKIYVESQGTLNNQNNFEEELKSLTLPDFLITYYIQSYTNQNSMVTHVSMEYNREPRIKLSQMIFNKRAKTLVTLNCVLTNACVEVTTLVEPLGLHKVNTFGQKVFKEVIKLK